VSPVAAAREDADVETSSDAYARRFAGPVGAWFLDVQARLTLELLAPWPGARVIDVGGGHAQSVGPLADAGHRVTVYGSDDACAARVRPWTSRGVAEFRAGDLLGLPYDDGAFDVALSYRLLPHVTRWRELLGELARVARRAVIVDYPTRRSVNAFAEAFFGLKKGVEGDTRPYTVFRDDDVAAALHDAGLRLSARRAQFFFPMALHRALGRAGVSRALEGAAGALGLVRVLGSPVIVRAERG
jgi:2-polyprenyl-3-methyl-5-hydroxy-6-metoxy-1,4-benzoquinol methylase